MRKNHSNRIGETTSDRWFNILCTAIVVILLLIVAYPVIYVLSASFSNAIDLSSGKVWLWPVRPNLEAYERLVQYRYIWIGYRNTFFYTVVGTLINIAVTLMCAYPLARRNLRGRGPIPFLFTFTMLFSGGMIPKIENALRAVAEGVRTVRIKHADDLLSEAGTTICNE